LIAVEDSASAFDLKSANFKAGTSTWISIRSSSGPEIFA